MQFIVFFTMKFLENTFSYYQLTDEMLCIAKQRPYHMLAFTSEQW